MVPLSRDRVNERRGAAYGSDQAATTYSPYSVYGNAGSDDALFKAGNGEEVARKKGYIQESQKRVFQSFLDTLRRSNGSMLRMN